MIVKVVVVLNTGTSIKEIKEEGKKRLRINFLRMQGT